MSEKRDKNIGIGFMFYHDRVPVEAGRQLLADHPHDFEPGTEIHEHFGAGKRSFWTIEGRVSRKLFKEFHKLQNG